MAHKIPGILESMQASLVAQLVKNLPAVQETQVQSLGWEDPLEKGMATHSSILAWRIPWTEKPSGPQSMGSQRVGHGDPWVGKFPWRSIRLPTPVFLGFPDGSDGKESTCNAGDLDSIPGLGRSPGGRHGNQLQFSCLENPRDRGAWQVTVHKVAKSRT